MQEYNEVPDMISGKDLDYLSDMFSWNYGALKSVNSSLESVSDNECQELLQRAYDLFKNNIMTVLNILKGGQNE